MTPLAILGSILQALAGIATNPVLGLGSSVTRFAPLLGYITSLAAAGDSALDELKAVNAQVQRIVASGAPPSEIDWADWDVRHEAAKARLQS